MISRTSIKFLAMNFFLHKNIMSFVNKLREQWFQTVCQNFEISFGTKFSMLIGLYVGNNHSQKLT
jgi:hypothetical protein